MSEHSVCAVRDFETIDRVVFSPVFVDSKTGLLKPTIWDHAFDRGCSVQRSSMTNNDQYALFIDKMLGEKQHWTWFGVVSSDAAQIRSIEVGDEQRACCLYDTAEPDNIWHAEFGVSSRPLLDADTNEIRVKLDKIFGDGKITKPSDFRMGAIKARVSPAVAFRVS